MAQRTFFIETYGCQMNVNDSEVVASLLVGAGFSLCGTPEEADVLLINTCAIRDNAEVRILGRLAHFRHMRRTLRPGLLIGVLGCMAARLRSQLLEPATGVDIVVSPDCYRELPRLIDEAASGLKAIAAAYSRFETYADVDPLRYASNGISAFVSIMRGCNKACTYCVVPFTRGKERSRDVASVLSEVEELQRAGYRELTLLGQTVDSYRWQSPTGATTSFAELLEMVAKAVPAMRVRFATSHPQDMTDEVLYTMAMYENICPHIHLPVQSGSDVVLERMHRRYTRAHYLRQIERIRRILPNAAITTDIIVGFCAETEDDFKLTYSLMEEVQFDFAYMFKYSERPGTYAARRLQDDVPDELKTERLEAIIELQGHHSLISNQRDVGHEFEVLVEGESRKSSQDLCGRTEQNKMVVFPQANTYAGRYATVRIEGCTSSTLLGHVVP